MGMERIFIPERSAIKSKGVALVPVSKVQEVFAHLFG
jgi:hypothetical protein